MIIHLCLFILPPVSQPGKGSREILRGTFSCEKAVALDPTALRRFVSDKIISDEKRKEKQKWISKK